MFKLLSILVFVFLSRNCDSVCLNSLLLNNVDAWVHNEYNTEGIHKYNESFYLLDSYQAIDITRANITELCTGMISKFPKLETLSLINVNLTKMEPNVFVKVPKLKHLSLSVNNLTEVKQGDFTNLRQLEILYLSNNLINTIEDDAFTDFPQLKKIFLDKNEIRHLSGKLFKDCPRLRLVDLSFNKLTVIRVDSFQNFNPYLAKTVDIRLISNKIDDVAGAAFSNFNSVIVHLERNMLSDFTDLFYKVKENSKLYLNNNVLDAIPDDVISEMRNTTISLYVENNPLTCENLKRVDLILDGEILGKGEFKYSSMFDCTFFSMSGFNYK